MFFKKQIDSILKSSTINGIELCIQNDGSYVFHYLLVHKKKFSFSILKKATDLTLDELLQVINKKAPFIISITGKGVIHKKVSFSGNGKKELLQKVLPNASEEDFNIQISDLDDKFQFVSVIRSSILNGVLSLFENAGVSDIEKVSLGSFSINSIIALMEVTDKVQIKDITYKVKDFRICDINYSDDYTKGGASFNLGNEKLSESLITPFSACIAYFHNSLEGVYDSDHLNSIFHEYSEKRKFKFVGATLLGTVFFIMLINLLFFNYFWSKNNEVEKVLAQNYSSIQLIEKLKLEYESKKSFLEQNGMLENSKTSFYSDRLLIDLPNSINFTDMTIHPKKKNEPGTPKEFYYFEKNCIEVSGSCSQSTILNDWMKKLKANDWIDKVELISYKQENSDVKGLFNLLIFIK